MLLTHWKKGCQSGCGREREERQNGISCFRKKDKDYRFGVSNGDREALSVEFQAGNRDVGFEGFLDGHDGYSFQFSAIQQGVEIFRLKR